MARKWGRVTGEQEEARNNKGSVMKEEMKRRAY